MLGINEGYDEVCVSLIFVEGNCQQVRFDIHAFANEINVNQA